MATVREMKKNSKESCLLLVSGIQERETKGKNPNPYLSLSLSDNTGFEFTANLWNMTAKAFPVPAGSGINATVECGEYNGALTYTIRDFVPVEINVSDFILSPAVDINTMYKMVYAQGCKCGRYSQVVKYILDQNEEAFKACPAAISFHHNILGGLLYHTYSMLMLAGMSCKSLNGLGNYADMFPGCVQDNRKFIDTDLVIAGIILHDIGKVKTYEYGSTGKADFSVEGALLEHLYIGAEMVHDAAKETGLPYQDELLLKHLIVSHHGKREWGAIQLPATPEAYLLHNVDSWDADNYKLAKALQATEEGHLSTRIFTLDNVTLYKPSNPGPDENVLND